MPDGIAPERSAGMRGPRRIAAGVRRARWGRVPNARQWLEVRLEVRLDVVRHPDVPPRADALRRLLYM